MTPSRIWITGSSGAGKTTMGGELATRLDLPHHELDALYHGPNWTPADPDEFRAAVSAVVERPGWVIDGNYQGFLGELVAGRAQLRIALDPPVAVVMSRVVRRTLRRTVTREELWNGNREPLRNLTRWDPQENIIRWAWVQRHSFHHRALQAERDAGAGGLPCVRLRTAGQTCRFLAHLSG